MEPFQDLITPTPLPRETQPEPASPPDRGNGPNPPGISESPAPSIHHHRPMSMEVEASPETRTRSRMRLCAIVIAIYLSAFLFAIDATMVSTALPTIARDLSASSSFAWVGSVYLLATAAGGPLWSNWSDIWGRKYVMCASIAVCLVGSIICACAPSINVLIAARVVQGLGAGGTIILVYLILSDIFSMRMRSLIFGMMEVVWAAAAGAGPVVGGAIAENIGWRWMFWLNVPIAGVAFALILIFLDVHIPRTSAKDGLRAIDWFGGLSITGLTVMLLLGLNFGGEIFPWSSPAVICLIIFGVLMFPTFIFSEKRLAPYPILPMNIYSDKSNIASLIGTMMQSMVVLMANFYLPLYFQSVRDASPTFSGVLVIPFELSEAVAAFIVGLMINKSGKYTGIIWGSTLLMTLGSGLFIDLTANANLAKVIAYQIVIGLGNGGLFQPYIIAVQARVPQNDQAAATAALGFARNMAGAMAIVVGGVVFQNGMLQKAPELLQAGLSPQLVDAFATGDAVANVALVGKIQDPLQREAARVAYATSMRSIWIVMTACAVLGLACSAFIKKAVLSTEHVETKTGLRREKETSEGGNDATNTA